MLRTWVWTVSCACLTACASAPPVAQVRAFANATDAFNAASQPLLDELAVAERERASRLIRTPTAGTKNVLDVPLPGGGQRRLLLDLPIDDVLAIATVGDPPGTAELRVGVATLKRYADVLTLLAENRNLEATRAELAVLGGRLANLGALFPGGVAAPGLVQPALSALSPLIDSAVKTQNAAETKRLVLDAAPKVHAVNEALRKSAEPVFQTLSSGPRANIVLGGDPRSSIAKVEGYRVALANWLVLLSEIDQATNQLAVAIASPESMASMASLTEMSTSVAVSAEAARRALAVVRNGR